ncbi:hypothetical protein IMAU10142_01717 [Lactobacillus helveticus]|uniref:hypothetical protein n=1 Tax=Lactobacillus helveticus TaxID=1587 RepID=UPI001563CF1F|nr:hypothetical protein [Lactobacillus helveticus]NRO91687.1 hypothetical protein [Lactobacillus helveticus]
MMKRKFEYKLSILTMAFIIQFVLMVIVSIIGAFPNINNWVQLVIYIVITAINLLSILYYLMRHYDLEENYRQVKLFKKINFFIFIMIVLIILISCTYLKVENFTKKSLPGISEWLIPLIKVILPTSVISPVLGLMQPRILTIQLFNVPFYYEKGIVSNPIIPINSHSFNISLHNFTKYPAKVFYLGICEADNVKKIMNEKDWDKNMFIDKYSHNKIPKSPKSFENIESGQDGMLHNINCNELKIQFKRKASNKKKYDLCAFYYIQEDEHQSQTYAMKHFRLK